MTRPVKCPISRMIRTILAFRANERTNQKPIDGTGRVLHLKALLLLLSRLRPVASVHATCHTYIFYFICCQSNLHPLRFSSDTYGCGPSICPPRTSTFSVITWQKEHSLYPLITWSCLLESPLVACVLRENYTTSYIFPCGDKKWRCMQTKTFKEETYWTNQQLSEWTLSNYRMAIEDRREIRCGCSKRTVTFYLQY